jgi:NADP-dependent 3-hydroxy acid dehydrogenase YdfG
LAKYGNHIVITARRQQLLREVAREINNAGSECVDFVGDATDRAHCEFVVQEIIKRYGRIDIAILNVGMGPPSNTLTASCEAILYCMRSNYDSMVNFFVPVMVQMKKQDTRCMISHIDSLASYFGIPMQGDYTAAKGAARIFIETARMELHHFGIKHIKLQTIHPGFVATDTVKN